LLHGYSILLYIYDNINDSLLKISFPQFLFPSSCFWSLFSTGRFPQISSKPRLFLHNESWKTPGVTGTVSMSLELANLDFLYRLIWANPTISWRLPGVGLFHFFFRSDSPESTDLNSYLEGKGLAAIATMVSRWWWVLNPQCTSA
jgi:hypothetical protein